MKEIIASFVPSYDLDKDLRILHSISKSGCTSVRVNFSRIPYCAWQTTSEYLIKLQEIFFIPLLADVPFPGEKTRIVTDSKITITANEKFILPWIYRSDIPMWVSGAMPDYPSVSELIYGEREAKITLEERIDDNAFFAVADRSFQFKNGRSLTFENSIIDNASNICFLQQLLADLKPAGVICSFVETAEQIEQFRKIVHGHKTELIAKIETATGINNLKTICPLTDMLLFGRGDLCLRYDESNLKNVLSQAMNIAREQKKSFVVGSHIMKNSKHGNISDSDVQDLRFVSEHNADGVMLTFDLVSDEKFTDIMNFIITNF